VAAARGGRRRRAGRVPAAVGVRDDERDVRARVAGHQAPVRLRHLVPRQRGALRRVDAHDGPAVVPRELVAVLARHVLLRRA